MTDSKTMGVHLLILFLFLQVFSNNSRVSEESTVAIKKFRINIEDSTSYLNIHLSLFKRLNYELLPNGLRPAIIDEAQSGNFATIISGSFLPGENSPILQFSLSGSLIYGEEIKNIPLAGIEKDQLLDLMVLKIRHFLDQNISGKLRISSTPLGCSVTINGITVGTTPAELTMEKGSYILNLHHEHLFSFYDTVEVLSGKEVSVHPSLRFKGYNQKPWIVTLAILTLGTTVSWLFENSLHKSYTDLRLEPDPQVFDKAFQRYRIANYTRIGLLNSTVICCTVNGFLLVRNNSLKKKIFGK